MLSGYYILNTATRNMPINLGGGVEFMARSSEEESPAHNGSVGISEFPAPTKRNRSTCLKTVQKAKAGDLW